MKQLQKAVFLSAAFAAFGAAVSAQDAGPGFGAGAGNSIGYGLYGLSVHVSAEYQVNSALATGLAASFLLPYNTDAVAGSSFFSLDSIIQPAAFVRWNIFKPANAAVFVQGNIGALFPLYDSAVFAALSFPLAFDISASAGLRLRMREGVFVEPFLRGGVAPFFGVPYGGAGILVGFSFAERHQPVRTFIEARGKNGFVQADQLESRGLDLREILERRPDWINAKGSDFGSDPQRAVFVVDKGDPAEMINAGVREAGLVMEIARSEASREMARSAGVKVSEVSKATKVAQGTDGYQATLTVDGQVSAEAFLPDIQLDDFYYEKWQERKRNQKEPVTYLLFWGKYSIPEESLEEARRVLRNTGELNRYLVDERERQKKRFESLRWDGARLDAYFSGIKEAGFPLDDVETGLYTLNFSQLSELRHNLRNMNFIQSGDGATAKAYFDLVNRADSLWHECEPARLITVSHKERAAALAAKNRELYAKIDQLREDYLVLAAHRDEIKQQYWEAQQDSVLSVTHMIDIIKGWSKPAQAVLSNKALTKRYTIKRGDTLVKIASEHYPNRFYCYWIATCNGIDNIDRILRDGELLLPPPPEDLFLGSPLARTVSGVSAGGRL